MSFFSSTKTIGILGGGQLGKMLLYCSRQWDLKTKVLDPSSQAPARLACDVFEVGDLLDYQTVVEFGSDVDVLTIEIENVNVEALKTLQKKGVQVYPQPDVLERIQNKCIQKQFYKDTNIPTASFTIFDTLDALKQAVLKGNLSFPFVWKSSSLGYDGYGVQIVRNNTDLVGLQEGSCLAEDLVPFEKELAVMVCRRPQGEIKVYPLVEMEFHPTANQVEYVLCPAQVPQEIEEKATQVARLVSEKFNHVGLLAVEMFLTQEGDILVNEVAPRPHNSGHYTIEAAYTSQFEQHIRAILDLPLGKTDNKVSSVMVNLVGKEGHNGPVIYKNIDHILGMEGVSPHIYGKKETRPFRKMGHVTIVHPSLKEARDLAEQVKESIEVISK